MQTARERLSHLLALAAEGPRERQELIDELADLLLNWPSDCPAAMRTPVAALLENTVREADEATRATLAARLGGHAELPLDLVNEFYLCAPKAVRREILARNERDLRAHIPAPVHDASSLIAAARAAAGKDFENIFGAMLHIAPKTAEAILADETAESLAVLCKGAQLNRAVFSSLALLRFNGGGDVSARLCAFDGVPMHAAENLTSYWQMH